MSVIKKFKDFFKTKPKDETETETEKTNRYQKEMSNRLLGLKDDVEYHFTDFEDLGAEVNIISTYKTERTFPDGSPISYVVMRPLDKNTTITHIGYLQIQIKFGSIPIDKIDDDFPDRIRRCLIEAVFRMNDNDETRVISGSYASIWQQVQRVTNRNLGSLKRNDMILTDTHTHKSNNGGHIRQKLGKRLFPS